jgi:hypothetical protein
MDLGKKSWIGILFHFAAAVCMALQCWFIATIVLFHPASYVIGSDYINSFHAAGWLVAHKQATLLYPPAGAATFAGAPFDQITHKFLPQGQNRAVYMFMYSPLVGLGFSPLAGLPPNVACFVWQCCNFVSLLASSVLAAASAVHLGSTRKIPSLAATVFLSTFLFVPVFNVLFLGQVDLIYGLLPMTLGFYLCVRKHSLAGGMALACVFLKAQFFPAAFLFSLGMAFRKEWKVLVGLFLGACLMAALSIAVAGPEVFSAWLSSLRLSEKLFSGGDIRNPENLVASLPLAILTAFSPASRAAAAPYVYGVELGGAVFFMFILWSMSRSRTLDENRFFILNLLISSMALIVFSPRFLTYDWVIFILPFALLLERRSLFPRSLTLSILGLIVACNVEILCQFCFGFNFPHGFIFIALTLAAVAIFSIRQLMNRQAEEVHAP